MRIAASPSILSPSPKDVDFLSWHLNRQRAARPVIGKRPVHLTQTTPCRPCSKQTSVKVLGKAAQSPAAIKLPPTNSGSRSVDSWASKTDSMWRCHPLAKSGHGTAVECIESEKKWSKSIFEALPRVGPRRLPDCPLAKLAKAASAPDVQLPPATPLDHSLKRISSIDSNVSSREKDSFPPDILVPRQASPQAGMEKPTHRVRLPHPNDKHKHHHSHAPSDEAELAHRWDMPLSTVLEASALFKEFGHMKANADDDDMLRNGHLEAGDLSRLVCRLCERASLDEIDLTPEDVMGIIDKDQDGSVDFREFVEWYQERAFLEYMNLSKEEIEVRRVAHKMGISVADMDVYKAQYDKFDTDSSGVIDFGEFKALLHTMMKIDVSKGLEIPDSRIKHFWQECDLDGSGGIDLEEFVAFYIKHFDPSADDPMEDYYKAIRRV